MSDEIEKLSGVPELVTILQEKPWIEKTLDEVSRREGSNLVVAHITQQLGDASEFYAEHKRQITPDVVRAFRLPSSWLE